MIFNIGKYDSTKQIVRHKTEVFNLMQRIIKALQKAATEHDDSSLTAPEKPLIDECMPKLNKYKKGTKEYDTVYSQYELSKQHHYHNNNHHPEYFYDGINDMTLVNLTEMLCDWFTPDVREEDIKKKLNDKQKEYGFSDDLKNILFNTAYTYFVLYPAKKI